MNSATRIRLRPCAGRWTSWAILLLASYRWFSLQRHEDDTMADAVVSRFRWYTMIRGARGSAHGSCRRTRDGLAQGVWPGDLRVDRAQGARLPGSLGAARAAILAGGPEQLLDAFPDGVRIDDPRGGRAAGRVGWRGVPGRRRVRGEPPRGRSDLRPAACRRSRTGHRFPAGMDPHLPQPMAASLPTPPPGAVGGQKPP